MTTTIGFHVLAPRRAGLAAELLACVANEEGAPGNA